jgi:D-threo-aldose 1-dehydrogenase
MKERQVGSTSLMVGEIGVGCGALGNLYREVTDEMAEAVIDTAWDAGLRYFDTAPFYGLGLSETRVGAALAKYPRDEYVLSSKVGRLLHPAEPAAERYGFVNAMPNDITYDYSYEGIMRSVESSLERTGLGRIDILFMHDIGRYTHGDANDYHFPIAMDGGYKALDELRSDGTVSAIGLGVNEVEVCVDAMQHGYWDCFLLAGRYTLLEQGGLHDFLPACIEAGTSIVLGGAYNSGILASGTRRGGTIYYDYGEAPQEVIDRVAAIEDVCDEHEVPLIAAALQFPLAHPAVCCVIPGMGNPGRIAQTLGYHELEIPAAFWATLKDRGLLEAECPVPGKDDA